MHLAKIIVHIPDSHFGEVWFVHDLEVLVHTSDTPPYLTAVCCQYGEACQSRLTHFRNIHGSVAEILHKYLW